MHDRSTMGAGRSAPSRAAIYRVRLLMRGRRWKEARAELRRLLLAAPEDPEVEALRRQYSAAEREARARMERKRDLRYWLHLNSPWRRWTNVAAAIVVAGLGVASLAGSVPVAMEGGLHAPVADPEGEYPVWYDLVFGGFWVVLAAVWLAVVWWLTRCASEWEALDTVEDPSPRPLWHLWWP